MKVKKITLRGWRSFSSKTGIELTNLKRINLIIGKNNTGKSNIFKYFFSLKKELDSYDNNPTIYDLYHNLTVRKKKKDTWAFKKKDINCTIEFEDFDIHSSDKLNAEYHLLKNKVSLNATHFFDNQKLTLSLLHNGDKPFIKPSELKNPKIYSIEKSSYIEPVDSTKYRNDTNIYWTTFLESLVFFDPIRHFSRQGLNNDKSYYFEGDDIINRINTLDFNQHIEFLGFKDKMKHWLKELLNEELEFSINHNKLRFIVNRDDERIEEDFDSLGTGVSQIFMLLSYLYLNKEKHLNIFLEEPENNIHPEALISLAKIFEKEFPKHTFFITTHSSSLIDSITENWTIHHIQKNGSNPSIINPCDNLLSQFKLLDDLGMRASQLIQSNIVIWVEGPSDRIYIKKWIELKTNNTIFENKHFSFLMYGGSNLAGYDLFADEKNIGILKTSRYAVIVCDSDRKKENGKLKPRVKKIWDFIKGKTSSSYESSKISEFVYGWITDGNEIENYVPNELFINNFAEPTLLKQRINAKGSSPKVDLKFEKALAKSTTFDDYAKFQEHYADFYKEKNDSRKLSLSEKKTIENHFIHKKVEISKVISSKWENSHFTKSLDSILKEVIKIIKKANNIKN